MPTSFFLALLVTYAIVAVKVEEWTTISLLGFRIETPQGFLASPGAYSLVRRALFIGAALSAFFVDAAVWYVGLLAVIAIASVSVFIGRKLAYNTFRRLHRLLAVDETNPTELAEIESAARLTDRELRERMAMAKKYAIQ